MISEIQFEIDKIRSATAMQGICMDGLYEAEDDDKAEQALRFMEEQHAINKNLLSLCESLMKTVTDVKNVLNG